MTLASLHVAARAWANRHRRALVAAATAALAVAPLAALSSLAPDAADLPRRVVSQSLPLGSAIVPQVLALAGQDHDFSRGTVARAADTIESLLARLGVVDAEAASFLKRNGAAARVLHGPSADVGRLVRARADGAGRLLELSARFPSESQAHRATQFARLVVKRDEGGQWQALVEEAAFDRQLRLAAGTVKTTLFAATEAADVPDAVAVQMAEIFSADLDFHREPKRGDRFVVVYEELSADGEPVPWNEGVGRVLAAEFVHAGRVRRALWFADPSDATGTRGSYYAPDGTSRKRPFLASPIEFARVSSGFAMRRDPIHRGWRAHLGEDHVAPPGTPVRAVGAGVVESAGWQGGYGQVVTLAHGDDRVTMYAHLSRILVKRGDAVRQGQTIGAVGATGWATGPHLHFEFRVHGVHQDPGAVARDARNAEGLPLAPQAMALFAAQRDRSLLQLDLAASLAPEAEVVASAR